MRIKAVGNTLSPDMTCCCEDPMSDIPHRRIKAQSTPSVSWGTKWKKTQCFILQFQQNIF
ncbi:hypothetical protein HMPREF9406_3482 [Clostridium sp. HGF2]|nr:hypothetical protein HMPREF9406_3482 [Clostridium sp. HGF2]